MSKDHYECPPVDPVLVEFLKRTNPLQIPRITQADREIWVEVGRQQIIGFLADHVENRAESA
jgi:hypothetical protein